MGMNIIAMTAFNRPHYLTRVLTALAQCHGIDRYALLVRCEPGCDEVVRLLREFKGPKEMLVHVNSVVRGCTLNYCDLMDEATGMSDFVVDLEDDIVPSPDFLAYMEWARNRYADDQRVFSISGYSQEQPTGSETYAMRRRKWFSAWGHGMWSNNWRKVRLYCINEKVHSWDMPIADFVLAAGLWEVFPVLSRVQNIGVKGTHSNPQWHAKHIHTEHVANCPAGFYFEK
jgi:hypothetical protein